MQELTINLPQILVCMESAIIISLNVGLRYYCGTYHVIIVDVGIIYNGMFDCQSVFQS